MLDDYSAALSSEDTAISISSLSVPMQKLVTDRKNYYKEFWEKGLHSKLNKVASKFKTNEVDEITLTDYGYEINLVEEISMYGEPLTKLPDQFPLIEGAKWALNYTNDQEVKAYLSQYISMMSKGVEQSVKDGVTIVFKVKHVIKLKKTDNRLRIKSDMFSDKSSDNKNGFDLVSWDNDQFSRQKPNWEDFPDYKIYKMSIPQIGRILLEGYENISTAALTSTVINSSLADRRSAVEYILQYTSNPDYYHYVPCDGYSVLQDTRYYNPDYSDVWNFTGCNDCADYVSQALEYSGFVSDSRWYPNAYNPQWVQPNQLKIYFEETNQGDIVDYLIILKQGDLAFKYEPIYGDENLNWEHVVMISGIDPYRYSGHTYDRYNYPINSGLNKYMIVEYGDIYHDLTYLPLMLSEDTSTSASMLTNSIQSSYPAPMMDSQNTEAYPAPEN